MTFHKVVMIWLWMGGLRHLHTYDQLVGHLVVLIHGSDQCMKTLISLPVEIIENQ